MSTALRTPLNNISMRIQERSYRLPGYPTTYAPATCSSAALPSPSPPSPQASEPKMLLYDPKSSLRGPTIVPATGGVGCQQPNTSTTTEHPHPFLIATAHQRPTIASSFVSLESGTSSSKVGSFSSPAPPEPVSEEPPRRQSDSSLDTHRARHHHRSHH